MAKDLLSGTEKIFHKIINGNANDDEKKIFYELLERDSELRNNFHHFKNLFVLSKNYVISDEKIKKEKFQHLWCTINHSNPRILPKFLRYAAMIILILSFGYLFNILIPEPEQSLVLIQQNEYKTNKGSISSIRIEDGSVIWLSSETNLILEKYSDGRINARVNGEAYFDLIPNADRNLLVDMGYFKIRDIGTSFNVRAYNQENIITVSLAAGTIDLLNKGNEPLLSLKPQELISFNKQTKGITVSEKDPAIVSAWKDNKFVFIDRTLAEICKELENWYNVEIIIANKDLAGIRYTSVVKRTANLESVLKLLKISDNIKYKIISRKEAADLVKIY